MSRRPLLPVHGWLIIDKPPRLTSAAVVGRVRRAFGGVKAGHAGTLDPLATGVLPIAIGEATKTVAYAMDGLKRYRFAVRWGEQRDTDDSEGAVTATSRQRPTAAQIMAILPQFAGIIEQVPPAYSAIKVDGRRAYALARAQQAPALEARPVSVESIALVEVVDADHAVFEVVAGKGVYMRSLARDLAAALGTLGHVAWLRRLCVGPFSEMQAVALDRIERVEGAESLTSLLLPVNAALSGMPSLSLTSAEARRLQRGQAVAALPVARRAAWTGIAGGAVVCAMAEGRPVALAQIRGGEIRPVRVLNLEQ